MASGPELMLKMLGIDPQQMQQIMGGMVKTINDIDARLSRIERLQAQILERMVRSSLNME